MCTSQHVLIETSVWVEYIHGRDTALVDAVADLIRSRRAAICGVVMVELLPGIRNIRDRERTSSLFSGLNYYEYTYQTWYRPVHIADHLRSVGAIIPLGDLLIAAIALQNGCAVYTLDAHFQDVPDLALYAPA